MVAQKLQRATWNLTINYSVNIRVKKCGNINPTLSKKNKKIYFTVNRNKLMSIRQNLRKAEKHLLNIIMADVECVL